MRLRALVTAGAAALALTLPAALPASQALAATGGPAPTRAMLTPQAPEVPNTQYCAAGETQVSWYDTNDALVIEWSASLNHFVEENSNHTILCQKNEHKINGVPYWEYAAVLNGAETNDCVSLKNGASKPVGLNGCSAGTNYLLWADIVNCSGNNLPPECIAADYTGDWVHGVVAGQPLQVATPAYDDSFWWFVSSG